MSKIDTGLAELKEKQPLGYWGERITAEIEYASKVSKVQNGRYDDILISAVEFLVEKFKEDTGITKKVSLEAEKMISELSAEAKKYKMICASHAHIDMNWMWAWDETVAVTIDTFRTMLDLMNEYPEFTFSQSQASVYRIIEEYAPELLPEIKARVKEGRWEVNASTWVENDKNMPNGESFARHILYTKRYLSKLLDINPTSLNMDFEPDTFGHSLNIPETLYNGGVQYYYHCRGYEGHHLYKWTSPSGNSIIVYREPLWYNAEINPSIALYVPEFCQQYHMDTMLKVYGVGDHGGGPTRRDLERIMDMNTWPVFPSIRFGTYAEYFSLVEKVKDQLPEVKDELNFIFTGCYTSQSRIKMANRIGEATLNEAELFNAVSALCTSSGYSREAFAEAWENILFNQFHDIIPGSGVIDTREHAMGLFQKTMAIANSRKSLSLRKLASQIDTSRFAEDNEDISQTISEGAGVGYGIKDFKIIQGERGRGKTRIFHVFNSALWDRREAVEITIWDWQGDLKRMSFMDDKGNAAGYQLLDHGFNNYWGHKYIRVLLQVDVPAGGYRTYVMTENKDFDGANAFPRDPRTEKIEEFVLENAFIKVVFDSQNASIISFVDKTTGDEYIDKKQTSGVFRYALEDSSGGGGSAWVVGRYMNVTNLTENVKIKNVNYGSSAIRQAISVEMEFKNSTLKAVISLDYDSPRLNYSVECDWHEIGKKGSGVPQLNFYLPFAYRCSSYKYDIPFGTIVRDEMDRDVPANSWALGMRSDSQGKSLMMISDTKYGFRGVRNAIALTLIRSSTNPDPYPELGIHKFNFTVCLAEDAGNQQLIEYAYNYNHPLNVLSDICHSGTMTTAESLLALEKGSIALSTVKMPEDEPVANRLILRVYETEGTKTEAVFRFYHEISNAYFVDINEHPVDSSAAVSFNGRKVSFEAAPYSVCSLCIEF